MRIRNYLYSGGIIFLATIFILTNLPSFADEGDQIQTPVQSINNQVVDYSDYDFSQGYRGELDEPIRVAYALADNDPVFLDGFLTNNELIDETHYFDCRNGFPDLEDLLEYDVVMTWSNYAYFGNGGAAMGDLLADYIDEGGAVVVCVYALYNIPGNLGIGGRLINDEYLPVQINGSYSGGTFNLGDYDENHPIMEGVESGMARTANVNLVPLEDAYLVASYTNNYPVVVVKQGCVALNMFLGNTNNFSGDFPLMIGNLLVWAVNSLGSTISGTVTHANSGAVIEGAVVNFYDTTADTLFGSDITDVEGHYECPTTFPEGFITNVRVTKPYFVDYIEEDIEIGEPEEIIMNFAINPFLVTTCEVIQTEVQEGTWVDVTGIVTQPTNSTSTEITSFYIQDHTQYGVHVFEMFPWDPAENLNRGDSVRVVGMVQELDGVTSITDIFEFEFFSSGNLFPYTLNMTTGAIAAMGEMEGTWAQIEGRLEDHARVDVDFMVHLNDGTGPVWVNVYESTGINDMDRYGEGDWFYIEGVISIYQEMVQIVPSLPGDVYRTLMYSPGHLVAFISDATIGAVDLSWALYGRGELDAFQAFNIYREFDLLATQESTTYQDTLPGYGTYIYAITTIYDEGETHPSYMEIVWRDPMEIEETQHQEIPLNWDIVSAYPNPFNSSVSVQVAVPVASELNASIYDITGRLVDVLEQGQLQPGYHNLSWTVEGPTGVYFMKISSSDGWSDIRKLVFMK